MALPVLRDLNNRFEQVATREGLREYVVGRLTPYTYPRVLRILDDHPTCATRKILERAIDEHMGVQS